MDVRFVTVQLRVAAMVLPETGVEQVPLLTLAAEPQEMLPIANRTSY